MVLNPLLLALVVFFYKQLAQYSTGTYGTEPSVTCTGGLFLLTTSAHTVLARVVVILLLALCGGGGGSGVIVTCTVWWWWWWWWCYCYLHCVVVVVYKSINLVILLHCTFPEYKPASNPRW